MRSHNLVPAFGFIVALIACIATVGLAQTSTSSVQTLGNAVNQANSVANTNQSKKPASTNAGGNSNTPGSSVGRNEDTKAQYWCGNEHRYVPAGYYDCNHCGCGQTR
jgi:hypothetical protein